MNADTSIEDKCTLILNFITLSKIKKQLSTMQQNKKIQI